MDTNEMQETNESIFLSVKKALNILPEDGAFDTDILIHLNSVLSKINQIGVGPEPPLQVTGSDETWNELFDDPKYAFVKSYIYLSVRLLFDPPSTTTMYEAFQRKIEELEWRLYVLGDEETINERE